MKVRSLLASVVLILLVVAKAGADNPLEFAGKEASLKIGGLLQVQGDFLDRGDSRFTTSDDRIFIRRARLSASGSFLESFDFKIELDLAGSLTNNPILAGNLRAQMTDGYVNWNKYAYANIKGGQFKTPFGYEQLFLDSKLYTIERSLVNDRLTLSRQIGAQAAGDVFEKRFSFAIGAFNGNGRN